MWCTTLQLLTILHNKYKCAHKLNVLKFNPESQRGSLKFILMCTTFELDLPIHKEKNIVVTYEIRVFFEGAQKEVFSSIFKKTL